MALTADQDKSLSELMEKIQAGDKDAYRRLLLEIAGFLKRYLERRLGAGPESEDVLQEILISLHNARHTYNPQKPFAPWIFAIARHRVCDYWRKTKRRLDFEVEGADQYDREEPGKGGALENTADLLFKLLDRLPKKQAAVVNLLKVQGFSVREASKKLNMTESAIKVNAHRGYEMLRRAFEVENDENI